MKLNNKKETSPKLKRVLEKPLKVFGKQLKVIRVILIALVGIAYAGMLYNQTLSYTPLVFGSTLVLLLIISGLLMYKRILYFGKYNLECSSAGDIYLTQLQGICPKCKGELKIVRKNNTKKILCDEDLSHIWNLKE